MIYDDRAKAALQRGIRQGLSRRALERFVAAELGVDGVTDKPTLELIHASYAKHVWPVTRAGARDEGARLF